MSANPGEAGVFSREVVGGGVVDLAAAGRERELVMIEEGLVVRPEGVVEVRSGLDKAEAKAWRGGRRARLGGVRDGVVGAPEGGIGRDVAPEEQRGICGEQPGGEKGRGEAVVGAVTGGGVPSGRRGRGASGSVACRRDDAAARVRRWRAVARWGQVQRMWCSSASGASQRGQAGEGKRRRWWGWERRREVGVGSPPTRSWA